MNVEEDRRIAALDAPRYLGAVGTRMPDRNRWIVWARCTGWTYREIGARLHISIERSRQVYLQALWSMRRQFHHGPRLEKAAVAWAQLGVDHAQERAIRPDPPLSEHQQANLERLYEPQPPKYVGGWFINGEPVQWQDQG